jgi:hypothetical protein
MCCWWNRRLIHSLQVPTITKCVCLADKRGRNEGGQTHLQREALHKIRIGRIRRTTLHDPPRLFGIGRRGRTEASPQKKSVDAQRNRQDERFDATSQSRLGKTFPQLAGQRYKPIAQKCPAKI